MLDSIIDKTLNGQWLSDNQLQWVQDLFEHAENVVKDTDNWQGVTPLNPQIQQDVEILRQHLIKGGSVDLVKSRQRCEKKSWRGSALNRFLYT